ncbi:crotonase/enoyl-CoA hydratase family protein [Pseudoalteromonas sp. SR44-5]|jgi:enoyl-CoA hydratase/carnithine racemase|uniref:crotonase/enoyl-CoA hydratase family protein n=1 Tax=Pseudoalteromonas TaxID=53246 RepID=UPI0015FEFE3C|nr:MULTISPECIES: crotonase/enoyl-CoA hydratase family protein [Pseudoalteromonas]MBB1294787.1 crotonase/enoyl-CoA hydratase family protein [Pseudoalteromonas sp. SR41-4]MBB1302253.1 crotonase/enoyl-CoA hydratase family protein [Pseudoalteromonas sp. SR44-8]MBB1310000.1 crotonase/enoyl-CoA hydratase family protein [Pseudoalteromonas sp. SR41-8]MBB1333059.1 crotonase/enoyl-CoA hydratase family protein [Pseudoalteromonas sp. SR41-6]MBB1364803.1 crotonase/enoyl-CoA hydratase family protein [Pseudo|tara:strand:+ start:6374 stop:7165 length:792 start_codon:yes stop_codon:yes gene_type:complete
MINFETQQAIAFVTLSRKDKQNALNFVMFKQLTSIIKKIKKDPTIRAVVIQGDGEHFCAGLDVAAVMKSPINIAKLLFKWLPGNCNLAQQVVLGWQSLSVPVFAVVQGNCFGGGLQIALGADYRIVHPDAKLAIMEARWGLCPDMGANVVLPSLLKRDDAMWLASHADPISADKALQLGLITEVNADPKQRCLAMINTLLARSPDTLAAIKRVTQQSFNTPRRQILAKETISQIRLLINSNTKKAIAKAKGADNIEYQNSKRW